MAQSPTQRSLTYLRKMGFAVDVVERTISIPARNGARATVFKRDYLGFADLIACRSGEGVIAIQTTSYSNVTSRLRKVRENEGALAWLEAGGRVRVHGWYKPGHRWVLRDEEILIHEHERADAEAEGDRRDDDGIGPDAPP